MRGGIAISVEEDFAVFVVEVADCCVTVGCWWPVFDVFVVVVVVVCWYGYIILRVRSEYGAQEDEK